MSLLLAHTYGAISQSSMSEMAESTSEAIWYFAYGSNLCSAVLTGKRGITPLRSEVVFLPDYSLCFNVLFLPYSDPAMAGLKRKGQDGQAVYGVAYLLDPDDFLKIIVTEGAGVAYRVLEAEGKMLDG